VLQNFQTKAELLCLEPDSVKHIERLQTTAFLKVQTSIKRLKSFEYRKLDCAVYKVKNVDGRSVTL